MKTIIGAASICISIFGCGFLWGETISKNIHHYSNETIDSKMRLAYIKGLGTGMKVEQSIMNGTRENALTGYEIDLYYLKDLEGHIIKIEN